jgi:hypothetical protein
MSCHSAVFHASYVNGPKANWAKTWLGGRVRAHIAGGMNLPPGTQICCQKLDGNNVQDGERHEQHQRRRRRPATSRWTSIPCSVLWQRTSLISAPYFMPAQTPARHTVDVRFLRVDVRCKAGGHIRLQHQANNSASMNQ